MSETRVALVATSGIIGVFWSLIGQHSALLMILFIVNILDYLTGIVGAGISGELSSAKGIAGVIKKLGYWVLVVIAMAMEYIMTYYMPQFGIVINVFPAITATVVVWLCVTETISILENLASLGVPFPQWLSYLVKKLKDELDKKNGENGLS